MKKFPEMYNNKTGYMKEDHGDLKMHAMILVSDYNAETETVIATLGKNDHREPTIRFEGVPVSKLEVFENSDTVIFRQGVMYAVDELAMLNERGDLSKQAVANLIQKMLVRAYRG